MERLEEAFKDPYKYGYHRTKYENVQKIVDGGFIPGGGAMYGYGFYMTYNLDSQLESRMSGYGDIILKSELFDKGILIFDYNVAKKLYGSNYTILKQLVRFGIVKDELDADQWWWNMSRACEGTFQNEKLSAELAYQSFVCGADPAKVITGSYRAGNGWQGNPQSMLDSSRGIPKEKKITGIMFSGNHDGDVVVVYNANTAKPVEYCVCDHQMLSQGVTKKDLKWEKVQNFEKANKRSENLRAIYNMFGGSFERFEVELENLDPNLFKQKYKWLMMANTENATVRIDKDGEVYFEDGMWKSGDWNGKTFDGIFKGGKFNSGEFTGSWEFGVFVNGIFNGYWKKGSWKGGIWGPNARKYNNDPITYFINGNMEDSELTPDEYMKSIGK